MERHEILEAMSELKLYGMRASFDEIAGKGLTRRDEIYPLIASLIRAERTHRQARSISYRIGGAKFPVLKDIDTFTFAETPIDEGQVRELATGTFLDAKRNAIFIGGTGTGKTHLCIAVASAVIRTRARGRFFNLVDLVNQLEQEKAAGRSGRLAEKLLRHDLIVIDELGYLPFSQSGGQLLFHLISKLYENTVLEWGTGGYARFLKRTIRLCGSNGLPSAPVKLQGFKHRSSYRSIKEIVRTLSVSRATVRKVVRGHQTDSRSAFSATLRFARSMASPARNSSSRPFPAISRGSRWRTCTQNHQFLGKMLPRRN